MNTKKRNKLKLKFFITYLLGFILAVSVALPAYIQSNFLKQFVSLKFVSLFFIVANLITVITIIMYPHIIKRISNYKTAKLTLILYLLSLLGLFSFHSIIMVAISLIIFIISSNLIWINMDIVLESFSKNNETGKIRTSYLTFINFGWIIAPAFSGYLIKLGNYKLVFLFSAIIATIFLILFIGQSKKLKDFTKFPKKHLLKDVKNIWNNKNLRGVFLSSLLLNIFYSSVVVYIPIYLHQTLGMNWSTLGVIFSIMLIPFVLIEIPAGIIADRILGEKEFLISGLIIIILSLFSFFFITVPIVWLWALILFISRIGAALVTAAEETYFFKIVDVEDMDLINLFRTTGPFGYIIGPALAIVILLFLPIHYIFLILGLIMILGIKVVAAIKDTK